MKTSEHLTSNQIAAFSAGTLVTSDSRTIGGHLIRCVACRSLLPVPDASRVWTAVTSEHDFGESQEQPRNSPSSERAYSSTIAELFVRRNRLAWAGGMLAVVVGMAGLILLSVSNQPVVETDVARSFKIEGPGSSHDRASEMNVDIADDRTTDSKAKDTNSMSADRKLTKNRRNPDQKMATTYNRATSGVNRNIARTRGTREPCSIGRTIEMELGSNKAHVLLRWKRVPKAAKYHVYVSDSDEILVDEFETEVDNSYVLTKPLDPTKFYQWKIVITLENGEKLYPDAQKFSVKDLASHVSSHRSKVKSDTRCLAN